MQDFTFENPPLVEVIAEVRWALTQFDAAPQLAVDPFYKERSQDLLAALKSEGYSYEEKLHPEDVPREFLAGNVTHRLRKSRGEWPLYQLGPGIFTGNMIPPYAGSKAFLAFLGKGLGKLAEHYPFETRISRINSLQLRKINAFGTKHLFENYAEFVAQHLQINATLEQKTLEGILSPGGSQVVSAEFTLPVASPKEARMIIKLAPGRANDEDAAILEVCVQASNEQGWIQDVAIIEWMKEANDSIRTFFLSVVSNDLLETFGERRPVEQ